MSLDKYAHLIKCKIWRRNWNKRKYVLRIQFSFSKNEHQNEVVWLIHWKRAVKYQCSDFPRHATLDVPRPWFVLKRRKRRVRNTILYDTSRFLTRRVPIQDLPSAVEYHGPVNSTKLLISRSERYPLFEQPRPEGSKESQSRGMNSAHVGNSSGWLYTHFHPHGKHPRNAREHYPRKIWLSCLKITWEWWRQWEYNLYP